MKYDKQVFYITISVALFILSATALFADDARPIPDSSLLKGGQPYFNSANYQSAIHGSDNLSQLAKTQSTLGEDAQAYGFAAKSDDAKFFVIGALYAEALAHIRGGNLELAAERLAAIEDQLIVLEAPGELYGYISNVRSRVALGKYATEVLVDMLSFFQPFFDAHARQQSQDKQILFQAGSWLVDMSLTAAADNKALIHLAKPQLKYFMEEMKRMDAPKGVLKAYDSIDKIADKEEISDHDVQKVLKQVKKIQTILG